MAEVKGRQFTARDKPDQRDYLFNDFSERARGDIESVRPKRKFKVQNQKNTPACTMFSACHISNGQNILEDKRLGVNREQIDPM